MTSGLQSITLMFLVTRITLYASILSLLFPSSESNLIWTDIVSSVSLYPFNTFTWSCSTGFSVSIWRQHSHWHMFLSFHHLRVFWPPFFNFPYLKLQVSSMSLYCFVTCIISSCSICFDSSHVIVDGFCSPLVLLYESTFIASWRFFISVLCRRRLCDSLHPLIPHILVCAQSLPKWWFPKHLQHNLLCLETLHCSVTGIFLNPSQAQKGWPNYKQHIFTNSFLLFFLFFSSKVWVTTFVFVGSFSSNVVHQLFHVLPFEIKYLG